MSALTGAVSLPRGGAGCATGGAGDGRSIWCTRASGRPSRWRIGRPYELSGVAGRLAGSPSGHRLSPSSGFSNSPPIGRSAAGTVTRIHSPTTHSGDCSDHCRLASASADSSVVSAWASQRRTSGAQTHGPAWLGLLERRERRRVPAASAVVVPARRHGSSENARSDNTRASAVLGAARAMSPCEAVTSTAERSGRTREFADGRASRGCATACEPGPWAACLHPDYGRRAYPGNAGAARATRDAESKRSGKSQRRCTTPGQMAPSDPCDAPPR